MKNVPDTTEMFLPDCRAAEKLFFTGIKNREELEFIDGAAKNIPPELFVPRAPFFNDSF